MDSRGGFSAVRHFQPPGTDYAARVRLHPNALLLPSLSGYDDAADPEEQSDDDDDHPAVRPRRSVATRLQSQQQQQQQQASSALNPNDVAARYAKQHPRRSGRRSTHLHYYTTMDEFNSSAVAGSELLVPIKIELDIEGYKLRDTFMWDVCAGEYGCGQAIMPEKFAETMCHDLDLPPRYVPLVALAIKNQIEEFAETKAGLAASNAGTDHEQRIEDVVPIELEILAGGVLIRDRFEWDINGRYTPEDFARTTCAELGLSGEFVPLFAAALREQLLRVAHHRIYGAGGGPCGIGGVGGGISSSSGGGGSSSISSTGAGCGGSNNGGSNMSGGGHRMSSGRARDGAIVMLSARDEWAPTVEFLEPSQMERMLERDKREARRTRRLTSRSSVAKLRLQEVGDVLRETRRSEASLEAAFATGTLSGRLRATTGDAQSRQQVHLSIIQQLASPIPVYNVLPLPLPPSLAATSSEVLHELPPPIFGDESWHCSHCYLDGSRTFSVHSGPLGDLSLCSICSDRLRREGELPAGRKDMFLRSYG